MSSMRSLLPISLAMALRVEHHDYEEAQADRDAAQWRDYSIGECTDFVHLLISCDGHGRCQHGPAMSTNEPQSANGYVVMYHHKRTSW
jgi:hypothetical protein